MQDFYALLEVSRDASLKEIRKAYLKKIRKYHPDVNKSPDAEKITKLLNLAYSVLSNQAKRVTYDYDAEPFTSYDPFRADEEEFNPEVVWEDISKAYKDIQDKYDEAIGNIKKMVEEDATIVNIKDFKAGKQTTISGKPANKPKKIRVKTSDGYFDIEFR